MAGNSPRTLRTLATITVVIWGGVALLSTRFAHEVADADRPIGTMLTLWGAAFGVSICSLRAALRLPESEAVRLTVFVAIVLRGLLLGTCPIQEVDIYRYVWDGNVVCQGVNPYSFTPLQIQTPAVEVDTLSDERRLMQLRDSSPGLRDVLDRVHYAELPTPYPPVSQLVFAAAALATPNAASAHAHVVVMKAFVTLFDLATLLLLIRLLRRTGTHAGWALAWAWCPLVLKEFANSGHLDSIAVFLSVAACERLTSADRASGSESASTGSRSGVASAALLALAVGAKLYPIVMLPLFTVVWLKQSAVRCCLRSLLVFVLLCGVVLLPMVIAEPPTLVPAPDVPPDPGDAVTELSATSGVETFLRHWEMNDFLFLVIVENLKPTEQLKPLRVDGRQRPAWFVLTGDEWRRSAVDRVSDSLGLPPEQTAFFLTRVMLTAVFTVIVVRLCAAVWRRPDARELLSAVFLTIAWFWLLCPTQNPWYWTWALPLIPFARERSWLAMSGLVLIYYLRFLLEYRFEQTPLFGTPYAGSEFFDFVVTWFEFAPFLIVLAVEALRAGTLDVPPSRQSTTDELHP